MLLFPSTQQLNSPTKSNTLELHSQISKWKALPGSSSIFLFHLIFQKSWAPVDIIEFIWAEKALPATEGNFKKQTLFPSF